MVCKPPRDVDSIGKLNEWLAECGVAQRDTKLAIERQENGDDIVVLDPPLQYEAWRFEFRFERTNRKEANIGYRCLIKQVAGALYERFSHPHLREVVWRIRPELAEDVLSKHIDPNGNEADLITYHGDKNDLQMVGYNIVQFYCRLGFVLGEAG